MIAMTIDRRAGARIRNQFSGGIARISTFANQRRNRRWIALELSDVLKSCLVTRLLALRDQEGNTWLNEIVLFTVGDQAIAARPKPSKTTAPGIHQISEHIM
jgi:hypothetical protein